MEILKESKEQLPLSFLADFMSRGWDQISMLKQEIAAIKEEFSGTKKVEELLQGLVDAYLVCVGQLELHIQNKDYLDFPEEAKKDGLKEELWPKEHNEDTAERFEEKEVLKARVRDWLAAEKPCEYQIADIPADLTWGDVIEAYKNGEEPKGLSVDSEPRNSIWQRAGELYYLQTGEFLDKDFEDMYNAKKTDLQTVEDKVAAEEADDNEGVAEDKPVEEPIEDEPDALSQEFHDIEPEENKPEEKEVEEDFEYFCDFDEPIGDALTDQDLYPEDKD